MANTKSALTAMRVAEKRHSRNRSLRSRMRTFSKRALQAVAGGAGDSTVDSVQQAISVIDRSASKSIIHPNHAARRKSRLMKKLNALQTPEA